VPQEKAGNPSVTNNRPPSAAVERVQLIAAFAVIASIAAPRTLQAATNFEPFATVEYTHNSNVFSRPNDQPPFALDGNTALGDSIRTYLAGLTADFDWGLYRLTLNGQGSYIDFDRFSILDHSESLFGGTFDWYVTSYIDGDLAYSQKRAMSPLADTLADTLQIQTDRIGNATVRLHLSPQWRLDLAPTWHQLDAPLEEFPDFGFRESGGSVTMNYLGISKLVAGLRGTYLDGSYHGIVGATKYNQAQGDLTAHYAVTGLSSFDGEVGYTRRRSSLANPDTGSAAGDVGQIVGTTDSVTGALSFHRQLSVKTGFTLRAFRTIDSYIAGANSQIGTGGEATLTWKPDTQFSVLLHYRQEKQSIEGGVAISDFQERTDRTRVADLAVEYHVLHWLTLRPYAQREIRTSNVHEANYNTTFVGIDLTARFNEQKPVAQR
jgi:hypothetical protein